MLLVADENVWLTQEMISSLYEKGRTTITGHLKNIFLDGELDENSVCRKFRRTALDGAEERKAVEVAINLLKMNIPVEQIVLATQQA